MLYLSTGPGQAYAICAVLLLANVLGLAFLTAARRAGSGTVINPEDTKLPGETEARSDPDPVSRIGRAHRNALENIPLFLIISLLYVTTSPSALGAWIYLGVFTLARYSHSFCYLKAIQPARTASFVVGALTTVGLMIQVLIAAI